MDDTREATDEAIAEQALEDKEQFGVLMHRYEKKLTRYLARLGVRTPEDRQDVLQEAFLKTYQNLASFDSGLSFSSWVYRIVHNEAMSFFRRMKARPEGNAVADGETSLSLITVDERLTEELDASLNRERLMEALATLPEKFRTILILFYFEEKSYTEISDILRIPKGTVATLLNRAKAKLKATL